MERNRKKTHTTAADIVCVAPQLRPAAPIRAKVEGTTPADEPSWSAITSPMSLPIVAPITCDDNMTSRGWVNAAARSIAKDYPFKKHVILDGGE